MNTNTQNHTITQEAETYITKLQHQITAIQQIKNSNVVNFVVDNDILKQLHKMEYDANRYKRKLEKGEFEIAIVGLEKAGKSTFANALIDNNILPRDDKRCTFTTTQIQASETGTDAAKVSFYSVDKFNDLFRDSLKTLGFPEEFYSKVSYNTLERSTYETMYNDDKIISKESRKAYGSTINDDILSIIDNSAYLSQYLGKADMNFGENQMEDLASFITEDKKARAVENVIIYSKKLSGKMQNAIIYDVPGFDSPTELHKLQTKQMMDAADAIIAVAKGEAPSLNDAEVKIFREKDTDDNPLSDKLFVFANKIDRATNVKQNINETYDQWIKKGYKGYIENNKKHRIIFGSALSYLYEKKIDTNQENQRFYNNFLNIKDKLPNGNGIDEIREQLAKYNQNERFQVLKHRIENLERDFKKLCDFIQEQFKQLEEDNGRIYDEESLQLALKLFDDSRRNLTKELEKIYSSIRDEVLNKKELSKQIRQYIESDVTPENYQMTDEEIELEHLRNPSVDIFHDVNRIDDRLREKKFDTMYQNFTTTVVKFADSLHTKYSNKILECLLNGMEINKSSSFYEELKEKVIDTFSTFRPNLLQLKFNNKNIKTNANSNANAKSENNDNNHTKNNVSNGKEKQSYLQTVTYYQALVERFSRDIYEILIYNQFSDSRLNKFYESIHHFLSLGVFYCQNNNDNNEKNKFCNINKTLEDIPLCSLLLKHSPNTKTKTSTGTSNNIEPSFQNENEYRLHYAKYHADRTKGKPTLKSMKDDFIEDIKALRDVLLNAFISAICIEKSFISRESKSTSDMKNYLYTDDFREFIKNNFDKIKDSQISDSNIRLQKIQQYKQASMQIKNILNNL